MSPTDPSPDRACPSAVELRAILLGRGAAGAADRLAQHLTGCARCAAAIDSITIDTLVLDTLRRGIPDAELSAAELADVVGRLSYVAPSHRINRPCRAATPPVLATAGDRPEMFGQYRLIEILGSGGMGVVYRAEDTALRRFVALKLLKPGADRDEQYRERFLREARAVAAVKHDNIVTVFQVGETPAPDGGTVPFLAMELLDGQSLFDWMRANPRPEIAWAIRFGRQAAAGLAAAHARRLIHRDVKPANLWLETPPGWATDTAAGRPPFGAVARVKLLDFGLARPSEEWVGSDASSGTPGYMAPEQDRGDKLDGRVDLYGLGCVLYELCTGRHPFPGRVRGWSNEAAAAVPSTVEANPDIPPPLATLIDRMLARDPVDRPASAREVEHELAIVMADGGRPTITDRGADTVFDTPAHRATVGHSNRRVAGILGCAVMAAAVMGWAVVHRSVQTPVLTLPVEPPPARPPFPEGPPDEYWCRQLAEQPPKEQFTLVSQKVEELNPGFDSRTTRITSGWADSQLVVRFAIKSNVVRDVRPLRALSHLTYAAIEGIPPEGGVLTDLSPLSGLRLQRLRIVNQPLFCDLTPLQGGQLDVVVLSDTAVESLLPLANQPIQRLDITKTRVSDLSPVKSMPKLHTLQCKGTRIKNFEPLAGTTIRELWADIPPGLDEEMVRRMPHLEKLNGKKVRDPKHIDPATLNDE